MISQGSMHIATWSFVATCIACVMFGIISAEWRYRRQPKRLYAAVTYFPNYSGYELHGIFSTEKTAEFVALDAAQARGPGVIGDVEYWILDK